MAAIAGSRGSGEFSPAMTCAAFNSGVSTRQLERRFRVVERRGIPVDG